MAGSDLTSTLKQPLFGIMVPWSVRLQTSQAGQGRGIDWTEYGAEAGRAVASGSTTLAIEGSGASDDTTLTACTIKVAKPGAPGPNGAGIVYRREVSGTADSLWYGSDAPKILTGYQRINGLAARHPTLLSLGDGTALVAYSRGTTSTNVNVRAADGTWGSNVVVNTTSVGVAGACLDMTGAPLVFSVDTLPGEAAGTTGMRVYRSTDGGTTWTIQTYECGISVTDLWRVRFSRFGNAGQIAAFVTTLSGGVYTVKQYVSIDNGARFSLVATSAAGVTAWDVREGGGFLHLITATDSAGFIQFRYVRIGDATSDYTDLSSTLINTDGAAALNYGAFCSYHPTGRLYVGIDTDARIGLRGWYTDDGGQTFDEAGPAYIMGASVTVEAGYLSGEFVRGTLVCVANDIGGGSASAPSNLVELRFGGHSRATVTRSIYQALDNVFVPLDTLANAGWSTAGDFGIPSRTLSSDTGQRIQTAALVSASHDFTRADSSPQIGDLAIRIDAGQVVITFETNGASVTVVADGTNLTIYDTFAGSGTPFAHGVPAGSYIEIKAVVDPSSSKAAVTYRQYKPTAERAFNAATTLTSLSATGTQIRHRIIIGPSSDVYIKTASVSWPTATDLESGWTSANLDPIPLSFAYVPLSSGWSLRASQGLAVLDGVTYDLRPVSLYRAENMLPNVNPSPAVRWYAADNSSDASFSLSIYEQGVNVVASQEAYALYLDGLRGVSSLGITDDIGTSTVNLGASFKYTALSGGKTIIPATSGARNTGAWVRADELRDWYFKDSSGTVSRVLGNTEGSLTWGTVSERRATIFLYGAVTGTAQTGTLYPARCVLIRYGASASSVIDIDIAAASQYTPADSTRSIGVMAAGRLTLVQQPALNDAHIVVNGANVQTAPDGSRLDAQRVKHRRRAEYNWAEFIGDERYLRGNETSPDYVKAYTGGNPAADAPGASVGLTLSGVLDRVYNLGSTPVVVVPAIPVGAAAGWSVIRTGEFMYARMIGDVRIERVPNVGVRGTSQMARVSQLGFEEEL